MNEPGSLMGRYFQSGSGEAIGAFSANDLLIACASVHLAHRRGIRRVPLLSAKFNQNCGTGALAPTS